MLAYSPNPTIRVRQDHTRSRLVNESARLFLTQGFENVSVAQIILATGMARSSFYRFFTNREALLTSIIRPVFLDGLVRLERLSTRQPGDIMAGIFSAYLELWKAGPDALRLSSRTGGVYFELFRDLHTSFREQISLLIKRVEKAGLLLNDSGDYTARLLARTAVPVMEIYYRDPHFEELFQTTMWGLLLRTSPKEKIA